MGDGLADVVEEIEAGPADGEAEADDSRVDHDFRCNFNQAASPGAEVAFAERIVCAAAVALASFGLFVISCCGEDVGATSIGDRRAAVGALRGCDFFSVKAVTAKGIHDFYVMVFLCLQTLEVFVTESIEHPASAWVCQQTEWFVEQTK